MRVPNMWNDFRLGGFLLFMSIVEFLNFNSYVKKFKIQFFNMFGDGMYGGY